MKLTRKSFTVVIVLCVSFFELSAQQTPAYLDTELPAERRAADLVQRMTLEEKASQLVNQARAVPRLGVPSYDWWSEALHGVASQGVTEFPEPIGLGATFDPTAIHRMATVIGIEGRVKNAMAVKSNGGHSNIFEGLDFWAPNINIFRDPRWGRGQETYGEDPFLTARMAVAFVTGMQGDDPKYYRAISTPKHYAVHSGPESTRHTSDVTVSKHDELDTYLPAFRAAVTEGKADSVMCAYNSINGQPACANEFLLQDQLRGKWAFKGYVVSDCGAVVDIFQNHKFLPSQAQSSAISLKRGMDNECVDFTFKVKDNRDYKPYADAVKQGYLKESEIDTALVRLFTARMKLGMFDPPQIVPYTRVDENELNSAANRELAHVLANESMVLLKNDGTLPLKGKKTIAVIGPLAEQTKVLLGNYNGTPTHTISVLEGMRKEFGADRVHYEAGTQFLSHTVEPVPGSSLTANGKPGVKLTFSKLDMSNVNNVTGTKSLAERTDLNVDAGAQPLPASVASIRPLSIHWDGEITATETGDYNLGLKANGFFRVKLDGKNVTSSYGGDPDEAKLGRVHLEAGKPAILHVEYTPPEKADPIAKLVWAKVDMRPRPEAIAAGQSADVIVAVLGISSELEGEEMQVSEPGFKGGDRTSIDLPRPEEDLLEALVATGKPVVLVLTNGSALAVNWAQGHVNAIVDAWYPGEEGGKAIAETISGKNNPSGRLPVTFYTGVDQLPSFDDYAMHGRTYRYFEGTPLYPFGFGLSYTTFSYSNLNLPVRPISAGQSASADVTVTNAGKVAGDEVAQLYLSFPQVKGAPLRALRGFQRVHLEAGQSQTLHFDLKPRDLSMVSEAGDPTIVEGKYVVIVGGGQPDTLAPTVKGSIQVIGSMKLPE
ncbi:glycoside hydrolase family 3 C-terminal domain-containing protein [Granulicella sp. S190]|uniref:glycoside hydrolase family 3 C-terminal domain-containing protein n=1 Tax=Granulicella sp. S190 TaxID=1747226 RepID=UPI00131DAA9F|nr:glycoside hydrolase family 3 C-terminal domain-containing protein [Granulicella sp. S190]